MQDVSHRTTKPIEENGATGAVFVLLLTCCEGWNVDPENKSGPVQPMECDVRLIQDRKTDSYANGGQIRYWQQCEDQHWFGQLSLELASPGLLSLAECGQHVSLYCM